MTQNNCLNTFSIAQCTLGRFFTSKNVRNTESSTTNVLLKLTLVKVSLR